MGSDVFVDGLGCVGMDLDARMDGLDGLVDGRCTVDGHGWMGTGVDGERWASLGVNGLDGFGLARMGSDWRGWVRTGVDRFEVVWMGSDGC
jgi:hypothetical protein